MPIISKEYFHFKLIEIAKREDHLTEEEKKMVQDMKICRENLYEMDGEGYYHRGTINIPRGAALLFNVPITDTAEISLVTEVLGDLIVNPEHEINNRLISDICKALNSELASIDISRINDGETLKRLQGVKDFSGIFEHLEEKYIVKNVAKNIELKGER